MKRIVAFMLVSCIWFLNPVPVQAYDISAAAGRLLGELIALISDEYVGSEVSQEELLEAAIRGMTMILDPYSDYMDEEALAQFTGGLTGKMVGLGVNIKLNDNNQHEIVRVLPETPAREAGLKKGDIITAINNDATEKLSLDDVIDRIGKSKANVRIKIRRGTESLSFTIPKRELPSISVYMDTLEEVLGEDAEAYEDIRYIAVTSISNNTATVLKSVIEQLQKEKVTKVIIDLRGNTGGYLDVAIDICNLLVPEGPACHIVNAYGDRETRYSTLKKSPFEQVVILVDRYTASGAELIAAAMQDAHVALIVGEETFGKGVIQSVYNLSTGGGLKLTTEEYLRRNGEKINELGITPDFIIENEIGDYETPRDIVLIKALELLS